MKDSPIPLLLIWAAIAVAGAALWVLGWAPWWVFALTVIGPPVVAAATIAFVMCFLCDWSH